MATTITPATLLTAAHTNAPGTSTNTASVTNTANALLLLAVGYGDSGGAPAVPSSITGLGLTWVLVDSQADSGTNRGHALYRAMGASSTGAITITWGTGTDVGTWNLQEFRNCDTSGTNGSGAIVQTKKTNAGSQTSIADTFGGTPAAASCIWVTLVHNDTASTITAGASFTAVDNDVQSTAPVQHQFTEINNAGGATTAIAISSTNAGSFSLISVEIASSSGPTNAGAIASAEAFGTPTLSGDNISPTGIASAEAFGVPIVAAAGGAWPDFIIEVAWANTALDLDANVVWTDISQWLRSFRLSRGRNRELARFDAGTLDMVLDNRDGRFSPEYSGSPYFGYVRPNKRVRVRAQHGPFFASLINVYANSWSEAFIKPRDAIVNFSGTDAFKLLAQYGLPDAWALAVQALSPQVWWRLNERSGTTFYDLSSSSPSYPATITGSTVTLDQNPVVPGADSSVSRAAAFTGTGEGKVVNPGVLPTTASLTSILFRSSAKAYNLAAPTSLTVSKPAGVVQNDILLAGVEIRGDKTISAVPTGWTAITTGNTGSSNNDAFLTVYWKLAGASEPSTYKWSFGGGGGGDAAIIISAFSGCNTASPIDTSGQSPQTNANVTVPSITAASTNEMLVSFMGHNPASTTNATYSTAVMGAGAGPGAVTEAADTNSQNNSGAGANRASIACDYQSWPTAIATGARTAALSGGSKANVGIAVLLKPAAGGVGGVPTPFTVAFWIQQSASQGNNDTYVKQGNIATTGMGVYQDILDTGSQKLRFKLGGTALDWSAGALVIPTGVPILVVARYDGGTVMALDTNGAGATTSRTGATAVVPIAAADFEFGLADCTMDEITVWPSYLTNTQVATLLAIAAGTAKTTAVVDSALTQVGWASDLRQIQPDLVSGQVVSNLATSTQAGDKVLDFLQGTPVETERGVLYMTGDGKVAFETLAFLQTDASRITPVVTFGQGVGEIGYTDLTPDYSDQILVNDVEVTNKTTEAGTVAAFTEKYSKLATDGSIAEFSTYTLSLNTNYDDVLATRQAAIASRMAFEITRYSQPQRRIFSISIEGTPTASDWDTLIALNMLNRVTVNHVAPGAPDPVTGAATTRTIAKDYSIRQFDWEYQSNPKSVKVTIGLDEGAIASVT